MKQTKTNAMRMLDRRKIPYVLKEFPLDGQKAAVHLGLEPARLFKTLVTTDTAGGYFVFCVPSSEELDLKKAARAVGAKRIEMLRQKELLPLTGYIHGGCSPVGMKKLFPTVLDESALQWNVIVVSAGHVGMLMELAPAALLELIDAGTAQITKEAPSGQAPVL